MSQTFNNTSTRAPSQLVLVISCWLCFSSFSLADTTTPSSPPVIPQAQSIDLQEPVIEQTPPSAVELTTSQPAAADDTSPAAASETAKANNPDSADNTISPAQQDLVAKQATEPPLVMLGTQVLPGTTTRLFWTPNQSFEGIASPTSVLVVNGTQPGPVLCLTAAVHGDELNGIEIVRRVLYSTEAEKLAGTLVGVPIVNLQGFHRSSRYLPDRRDLNRFFPGNPYGSSAARIAHSFFTEVISHCDALVDLHTGSMQRINLPQLRADLKQPGVVALTQGFGATAVLHSDGQPGTLRRAATDHGIPAVTLEAGGSMRLEEKSVSHGVKGIQTLINSLGMNKKISLWGAPEPVYYQSTWVRANQGGILFSKVKLGERVKKGKILGTVTDPITNIRSKIVAPHNGRILGMALNQVVMPGFASFRIGTQQSEKGLPHPEESTLELNAESVDYSVITPDNIILLQAEEIDTEE